MQRGLEGRLPNGPGPAYASDRCRQEPRGPRLLDEFWPDRTVHAFSAVLVAGGVLPRRDRQLAKIEQWGFAISAQQSLIAQTEPSNNPSRHQISRAITAATLAAVRTVLSVPV